MNTHLVAEVLNTLLNSWIAHELFEERKLVEVLAACAASGLVGLKLGAFVVTNRWVAEVAVLKGRIETLKGDVRTGETEKEDLSKRLDSTIEWAKRFARPTKITVVRYSACEDVVADSHKAIQEEIGTLVGVPVKLTHWSRRSH